MFVLDRSATRAIACAGAMLAAIAAAAPASAAVRAPQFGHAIVPGVALPRIQDVAFREGSYGYTATISGVDFGAQPADVPCTACTPVEVQVVDMVADGGPQPINVVSWTSTSIVVTGIFASPGDSLEIDVYNDAAGNAGAWGGLVSEYKGAPKITSFKTSGSGATLTVTVNGKGFGAAPSVVGQNTNSPFFMFSDINNGSTGTGGARWNAGYCGAYECDGVTMGYVSWSDTQIVMSTFGSEYGANNWFIDPGDAVCVGVWPSTSESNGTTGGTAKCGRLAK